MQLARNNINFQEIGVEELDSRRTLTEGVLLKVRGPERIKQEEAKASAEKMEEVL